MPRTLARARYVDGFAGAAGAAGVLGDGLEVELAVELADELASDEVELDDPAAAGVTVDDPLSPPSPSGFLLEDDE